MDPAQAYFRFYAELNDHLSPEQRHETLTKPFFVPGSVKDMIESCGVPHPEVELIIANGEPVAFSYLVRDGDRIAVYPRFQSFELKPELRRVPQGEPRFVLDVHLGRLAAYLRMVGFDTVFRKCFTDSELVRVSSEEERILLTRDRGLLMHNAVVYGYLLRQTDSHYQLTEIVNHFDLARSIRPFTRCMACNGILAEVPKEQVQVLLPTRTAELYNDFSQCPECRRIYWKGSHYRRMLKLLSDLALYDEARQ